MRAPYPRHHFADGFVAPIESVTGIAMARELPDFDARKVAAAAAERGE